MANDKSENGDKYSYKNNSLRLHGNGNSSVTNDYGNNILRKFRVDIEFRHKIVLSMALFWLSVSLGWNLSQLGPSLQDLMIITRTELDEASYFFTTLSLGFLVGASVAGWMLQKINPMTLLSVHNTIFSIVIIIIPWCTYYGLMIVLFLIRGVTRGVVDASSNILIMETWRTENAPYMQTLHFLFAIGGIISPLVSAPFLSESAHNNETIHIDSSNNSYILRSNGSLNLSSITDLHSIKAVTQKESNVHVAFLISGILALSGTPLFVYFACSASKQDKGSSNDVSHINRTSPTMIKRITLSVFCTTFFCYLVVEKAIIYFVATFVVEHFTWTASRGSYVTTIYWSSFAIGRFVGIFITNRFRLKTIVLLYVTVLLLSSVGLMITTLLKIEVGIWIFVPLSGFCQSILFPLLLSWMEEDFFKVSGKMISLILFLGSIGSMITPIILGNLMDVFSPMWFPYFQVIGSFIFLILCVVLLFLTRNFKKSIHENELFIEVPKKT